MELYLAHLAGWVLRSTQVPSGATTVVGSNVFLSITMMGRDLLALSVGGDLPCKGMTF
jgi:hypothetical protein